MLQGPAQTQVLLTGGTGFVGRNLKAYLQGKCQIKEISLRKGIPEIDRNIDAVIHLAGKAHDLKNVSNPEAYYQVNFELTRFLFDQFVASNASKFIFISSVKAVADHSNVPLKEDHIPDPKTDYGRSKLMAEDYIQAQKLPEGKAYYILRPCMIHGPGNKGNLNLLYQLIQHRIPYPLAAFENRRSFLSVENLCFVINELVIRDDIAKGVYHISDDRSLSTNELVALISKQLAVKIRFFNINRRLISMIAKIGDALNLPINTERIGKLTETYVVDNSKLKNALGKALPVEALDGLHRTVESFITGKNRPF